MFDTHEFDDSIAILKDYVKALENTLVVYWKQIPEFKQVLKLNKDAVKYYNILINIYDSLKVLIDYCESYGNEVRDYLNTIIY